MLLTVAGRFKRAIVLGEVTYPVMCPQVDQGTLFYICDNTITPNLTTDRFAVQINGDNVDANDSRFGWQVVTQEIPSPITSSSQVNSTASLILFNNPLNLELPFVTCSGFHGLSATKSPVLTLLEDYGRYAISDGAKRKFRTQDFSLSVYSNAIDTVLAIVKDRLIPQTPFIFTFRQGRVELFELRGNETGLELGVGYGLYGRDSTADGRTSADTVWNALDTGYHRNVFTNGIVNTTQRSYLLDKNTATGDLKRLLEESESNYGRRYLKMDAPDVVVADGEVPPILRTISADFLRLAAQQHRVFTYTAPHYPLLCVPENSIFRVSDPDTGLDRVKVRMVKRQISPLQLKVTLQEES